MQSVLLEILTVTMKTPSFSKGRHLRYLSTSSHYLTSAENKVSYSRPLFGNLVCNKSYSLISSSGSLLFRYESYPCSYFNHLCNYHGCSRRFSSFSLNGLSSVSSIAYPCSQSSKCLSFSGSSCNYDDQNSNLYVFLHPGFGYFRLYSKSASAVSQNKDLHSPMRRRKATRNHASMITRLIIAKDNNLKSNLNSLSGTLPIGSVNKVFNILNRKRKSALQFFHWIRCQQPELEHNSHICSLIINNCGVLNDYTAMRCLLKEFSLDKLFLTKTAFKYLKVISANEDLLKNSIEEVIGILQEVGGTSYGTGVHSLIEMFSDLGSFDIAKFVIEKTQRKLSYYNILIREMCRRCDFEAVKNLMNEMRVAGCDPSQQTYNYIISSLLKNGKNIDAYEVLQEMKEKGCPPDALTFEIFIFNYCSEGKFDKAFEFFNHMVAMDLQPRFSAHTAFIKGFFKTEQYEKAYKYVADSNDKYSSSVNYSLLAALHLKGGNAVDAEKILSEMMNKGLKPPFSLFMRVKKNLLKSGNKQLAADLQKKFQELKF